MYDSKSSSHLCSSYPRVSATLLAASELAAWTRMRSLDVQRLIPLELCQTKKKAGKAPSLRVALNRFSGF